MRVPSSIVQWPRTMPASGEFRDKDRDKHLLGHNLCESAGQKEEVRGLGAERAPDEGDIEDKVLAPTNARTFTTRWTTPNAGRWPGRTTSCRSAARTIWLDAAGSFTQLSAR